MSIELGRFGGALVRVRVDIHARVDLDLDITEVTLLLTFLEDVEAICEGLAEEPGIASLLELGRLGLIIGHLAAELVLLDLSLKEVEWLGLRKRGELRVIIDLRLVKALIVVMIQNLHGRHAPWVAKLLDLKLILNPHNLCG